MAQECILNKVGMPITTFDLAENGRSRLAQPLPIDLLTGKPQKVDIHTKEVNIDRGGSCNFPLMMTIFALGRFKGVDGSYDGH